MWLTNGKNGDENEFTCNIFEIEIFLFSAFFANYYCCNPCYSVISFALKKGEEKKEKKELLLLFIIFFCRGDEMNFCLYFWVAMILMIILLTHYNDYDELNGVDMKSIYYLYIFIT